jgi:hypothetical protein
MYMFTFVSLRKAQVGPKLCLLFVSINNLSFQYSRALCLVQPWTQPHQVGEQHQQLQQGWQEVGQGQLMPLRLRWSLALAILQQTASTS